MKTCRTPRDCRAPWCECCDDNARQLRGLDDYPTPGVPPEFFIGVAWAMGITLIAGLAVWGLIEAVF
jgi:hypothetical protein